VRRVGVPQIRLHDLRHTHASHLLAANVNVKVVSERLGHASSSFTMDTYGHLLPGQQAEAALAAARLLTAPGSTGEPAPS
jgi:integrase